MNGRFAAASIAGVDSYSFAEELWKKKIFGCERSSHRW